MKVTIMSMWEATSPEERAASHKIIKEFLGELEEKEKHHEPVKRREKEDRLNGISPSRRYH